MEIIDTHCHLDVAAFDHDRETVLDNCHARGIDKILVPAIRSDGWDNLLQTCERYSPLFPALGLHPLFIQAHNPDDLHKLQSYIARHKPVAVGEIGLDFYIPDHDAEKQTDFFAAQLDIAKQEDLPVILHVRKAHEQVLAMLKHKDIHAGVVHAFSGSLEQAQRYIQLGFKLGFGGMLTYTRAKKIRRLAGELPLSALVLETDAPDMAGENHHGQRNSPEYLPEYLQALCALRDEPPDSIAMQTTCNANETFALS